MIRSMLPAGSGSRQTAMFVAVLLLGGQTGPPRYTPGMLECAAYLEEVHSDIKSETGGVSRTERAGRTGVLVIRSPPGRGGLNLEAWYDSLSVWREGPEGKSAPETDGLVGGRWRGTLTPDGSYSRVATPFIPDELSEIADLSGVLDDFLPRLPEKALADGERYRWTRQSTSDTSVVVQDSLLAPVHREVKEEGSLVWDRRLGPTRWERTLTLGARIGPRGPFKKAVRSEVTQRIEVTRLPRAAGCS